jgi:4,5-DOPA dioxygenase extradiol
MPTPDAPHATSRRSLLRYLSLSGGLAAALGVLERALAADAPAAKMPSIFIGHGSPMNALQDNRFSGSLRQWGRELGRPRAILMVSAHWLTRGGTSVAMVSQPETIHDFGGFPRQLTEMQYPALGSPRFAQQALTALKGVNAQPSQDWGLDHGAWTVLHHMYPLADVPVFQVSIDYSQAGKHHFALGRALAGLRDQGVLIAGSGNVVHNLRATEDSDAIQAHASKPWAQDWDDVVKKALSVGAVESLMDYRKLDASHAMAVPTPDHYWPLLYALGAAGLAQKPAFTFEGFQNGTISMRCMQWG